MEKKEFFDNEFSYEIWKDSYKLNIDKDVYDTFKRVAYGIFKDEPEKAKKLYNALIEHKISLGGRIIANVGSGLKNVSYFNCYGIQRTLKPYDSLKCIYSDLSKAADILKSEGGVGFDFSHLRPKGTLIKGVGVGSPGVIDFMRLFSYSAGIITKGSDKDKLTQVQDGDIVKSKIRKGAQIAILDIHHPEIIDFIYAKQKPNNGLEYFNISVKISDDFMEAVEKDEEWELWFPDIHFEKYDEEWEGDFIEWKNKNYPRVIYQTIKAKELWNMILESAYNRAEPGILFQDNFNRYNNLFHKGMKITGTNPCLIGTTRVLTNKGWIQFKKLTKLFENNQTNNVKIISKNIKTGELQESKLKWCGITKHNDEIYQIEFDNGEKILVNKTHRLYDKDFNELTIENINIGEQIQTFSGLTKIINIKKLDKKEDVYDLTAEPNYNFFALNDIEEDFTNEKIIINDEIELYPYNLIKINGEPGFAKDIKENDKSKKYYLNNSILTPDCGELPMIGNFYIVNIDNKEYKMMGDICNLGHLNLTAFYDKEKGFDFEDFKEKIYILVETLDKLIDISGYVFPELENAAKLRRKLGCGILGYGSLLYMMGLKYGSKESLDFTHKLMSLYANTAYQASALLAKEKGTFALYDEEILNDGFIKNSGVLTEETIDLIKKYGLRNSQLLTIAPTGNTGIFQNNVSGGLEPVFAKEYYRWVNVSHRFEEMKRKYPNIEFPDFENGEYKETKDFYWDKQGDEPVLKSKDGNFIIDKTRGLVKKELVIDYGYKWCKNNLSEEEFKEREKNGVFVTTSELTVKEHVDTMIVFSKYIDNSISKTINLPHDYKFEDFDKLFFELWKNGVRGATVYREGTMTAVLEKKDDKSKKDDIKYRIEAEDKISLFKKELYNEEKAIRYIVKWKNVKVYIIVVYDELDGLPLEIFAQLPFEAGFNANGQFDQMLFLERLSYWNLISRLLSILFRYSIPIEEIKEQLSKSSYSISSLSGMLLRVLKKFPIQELLDIDDIEEDIEINMDDVEDVYKQLKNQINKCPTCGAELKLQEGCYICPNCGYSKCG